MSRIGMRPVRGMDLPVVRDTAPRLSWNIAHTCSPVSSLLCLLSNVCSIHYVVRKEKIAIREDLPLTVYLSTYRIKVKPLIEGVD